jgi:hypothetical protein
MASQTINARSEIDTTKMRIDPHSAMKDTYVPSYCLPEFGKDGVVKGELKDGYFVPSGAMLPCEFDRVEGGDDIGRLIDMMRGAWKWERVFKRVRS